MAIKRTHKTICDKCGGDDIRYCDAHNETYSCWDCESGCPDCEAYEDEVLGRNRRDDREVSR